MNAKPIISLFNIFCSVAKSKTQKSFEHSQQNSKYYQ